MREIRCPVPTSAVALCARGLSFRCDDAFDHCGHHRMNPWAINPTWENFSEAAAADDALTTVERTHHLTAALYFGAAALEGFINEKTRARLERSHSDETIVEVLRYGLLRVPAKDTTLCDKLRRWPAVLTGHDMAMPASTWDRNAQFNDLRGNHGAW